MMASFQIPPEQLAKLASENKSPKVIALVSAFTAIGFVSVVLRFFTRAKFVGFLGLEDYFIAISMVGTHSVNDFVALGLWTLYSSFLSQHLHA